MGNLAILRLNVKKCRKNNFNLKHISQPGYFYTKNFKTREHRFNFRKDKLKKLFPDIYAPEKTEFEIMNEAGYSRIWDCGNAVYEFN